MRFNSFIKFNKLFVNFAYFSKGKSLCKVNLACVNFGLIFLIWKIYAKRVFGSYENLEANIPATAMRSLTGIEVDSISKI